MHKAGKQLKNDIPGYYAANPEFGTKPNITADLEVSGPAQTGKGR